MQDQENIKFEEQYHDEINNIQQKLPDNLDTGDILLFSRQCNAMGFFGGMLCYLAKTFSPWDHVAVVVCDPQTGIPYAVEVSFRGVKLIPAISRIASSKSTMVAVRYLRIHRTPEMRENAWKEAKNLEGKPYTTDVDILARAGLTSPYKLFRSLLYNRSSHLLRELLTISHEESNANINDFLYTILQNKKQHMLTERSYINELIHNSNPSVLENKEMDSSYFCSQGTATILKTIGVLPQNVPTTEYMPYTFSSDVRLPLLKGANFSPEIYLRGHAKDTSYEHESDTLDESLTSIVTAFARNDIQNTNTNVSSQENIEINKTIDYDLLSSKMKLSRQFARLSKDQIIQFIKKAEQKTLLPGETINLLDSNYAICLIQDGIIHINNWSDMMGERKIGIHGQNSVFGTSIFSDYSNVIARACSHCHSHILHISKSECQDLHGDASMLHGSERIRLIRYLQQNKHFQHLSYLQLLVLSSYFYKVKLEPNQCLYHKGDYCDHLLVIDKGYLYQKVHPSYKSDQSTTTYKTTSGNIYGCSALIYGIPRRDYVYSGEEDTVLFCLDPTVFHCYTGEWCPSVLSAFNEYQNPMNYINDVTSSSLSSFIKSFDIKKSISSMYTQSVQNQNTTFLSLDPVFKQRINCLAELMFLLFPFDSKEEFSSILNEDTHHKLMAIFNTNKALKNAMKTYDISMDNYLSIDEKEELNNPNEFVEDAIHQIQNILILRKYDNQALIRITDIFRMDETQAMLKALYYAFVGRTASHVLTKDIFIQNGQLLGILKENDPLIDMLFKESNEINCNEFNDVILKHKNELSPELTNYINKISSYIHIIDSKLPHNHKFTFDNSIFHPLPNPYGLLPVSLPVPLPLLFSVHQPQNSPYLYPSIIAGILGELIGSIILFPTYVSALSSILNLTSKNKTLKNYIFREKPKVTTTQTQGKKTSKPSIRNPKFLKEMPKQDLYKDIPISKSVNDLIHPQYIEGITRKSLSEQFLFLKGLPKNMSYILYRNLFEVLAFPICFRYIYDMDSLHSLPLWMQTTLTAFIVGSAMPALVFPWKKRFQIQMLEATEIKPLSFWVRNYRGLLSTMLHQGILLALFIGPFTYYWMKKSQSKTIAHQDPNIINRNTISETIPFNGNTLLDAVTLGAITYTGAYLASWPLSLFKRYKTMQGYQVRTQEYEIVRFSKNYKLFSFFNNRTFKQIYRGASPRLYNGLISVCLGIVCAGCGYRYSCQKKFEK